jgi:hypothetical protein
MNNITTKNVILMATIISPLLLSACGGGGGSSSSTTQTPPPVSAQAIIPFTLPALAVGASINLSVAATSGLPVTYTSTTPTTCTVSGSIVTGIAFGSCGITVSQAGNSSFSSAASAQSVQVGAQTIKFSLPNLMVGELIPVTAIATSNLPVTLTSLTPLVCLTDGLFVNVISTAASNCTIEATQGGTNQYTSAPPVSVTVAVSSSSVIAAAGTTPYPTIFPQAGSTFSDPSTTIQGVYQNTQGDLAFVDSTNHVDYADANGILFGLLQTSGSAWTLAASSIYYADLPISSNTAIVATGNGTFATKNSFDATTLSFMPSPSPLSLFYSFSNGLAVTQSSLVGTWILNSATSQLQLSIDSAGVLMGVSTVIDTNNTPVTSHQCSLSGSVLSADQNTSHNLFNIVINAAATPNSGTTCDLTTNSYKGLGALRYFQVTMNPANGLTPRLSIIMQTSNGNHNALNLVKRNF